MKKTGPTEASTKKLVAVSFKISITNRDILGQKAADAGMTISEYLRDIFLINVIEITEDSTRNNQMQENIPLLNKIPADQELLKQGLESLTKKKGIISENNIPPQQFLAGITIATGVFLIANTLLSSGKAA